MSEKGPACLTFNNKFSFKSLGMPINRSKLMLTKYFVSTAISGGQVGIFSRKLFKKDDPVD